MPQPLDRVRKISSYGWGAGSLSQRPKLALLVVEIIGCWSDTETAQARLFVHFMGAEARLQLVPYLALVSPEARRAMLREAAAESLKGQQDDLALFTSVMKATQPVRARRNDLAHGVWGTSDELPDALLWCSQEDLLCSDVSVRAHIASTKVDQPAEDPDFISREWSKNVFVYRAGDLVRDLDDARGAYNALYLLHDWLKQRDARLKSNLLRVPLMSRGRNGETD